MAVKEPYTVNAFYWLGIVNHCRGLTPAGSMQPLTHSLQFGWGTELEK